MRVPSGPATQTPGSCWMRSLLTKTVSSIARECWVTIWADLSVFCLGPVVADTDVHGQRRIEIIRADHLAAHDLLHLLHLRVRHLQQQLVVHLEDEPRAAALLA